MPLPASEPFSIHFSAETWQTIGEMDSEVFETAVDTLEYFARHCARRLARGGRPSLDAGVPIATGSALMECTIDDDSRRITVTRVDAIPGSSVLQSVRPLDAVG